MPRNAEASSYRVPTRGRGACIESPVVFDLTAVADESVNWLDLLERTARTFVQGFLAVVTFDSLSEGFNPTLSQKLLTGVLSGVFAVLTKFAGSE